MTSKREKIAVFDIDGTIFRKNLHFELINELAWMGVFPRVVRDRIVKAYAEWLEHSGTYEHYRVTLVDLYEKCIKGCKREDVIRASKTVVAFHKDRTYMFTENLIKDLKEKKYHVIAISGSPLEIVKEYNKTHLKFDMVFGSVYECDAKGCYTGRTSYEPTHGKGEVMKQYAFEHGLTLEDSYGVGDTESDVSFLELATHPIAFNPNENLKKIAQEKGWRIVVEKKDVIWDMTACANMNLV